jgi:hypothetical protein
VTTTMTSQRERALAIANQRRLRNAALLNELRDLGFEAAHRRAAEVVADPDDSFATIKARNLLCALPSRGPQWVPRALSHAGLNDHRLGDLTSRQREALIATLPLSLHELLRRNGNGAGRMMIVTAELAVTPERLAAVRRALAPYVASPVLHAAAEAALNAAANVRADQ